MIESPLILVTRKVIFYSFSLTFISRSSSLFLLSLETEQNSVNVYSLSFSRPKILTFCSEIYLFMLQSFNVTSSVMVQSFSFKVLMNSGLTPEPELDSKECIVFQILTSSFSLKLSISWLIYLLKSFTRFYIFVSDFVLSMFILFIFQLRDSIALLETLCWVLDFSYIIAVALEESSVCISIFKNSTF